MVWVPALGIHLPRKNKAYLDAVHKLPCCITGSFGVEAHHPKGLGWGCGMGQKAPDETAIPLRPDKHAEYHRIGRDSFEAKYGSHLSLLEDTWRRLKKAPSHDEEDNQK